MLEVKMANCICIKNYISEEQVVFLVQANKIEEFNYIPTYTTSILIEFMHVVCIIKIILCNLPSVVITIHL
jgi:hypothetical protein